MQLYVLEYKQLLLEPQPSCKAMKPNPDDNAPLGILCSTRAELTRAPIKASGGKLK